MLIFTSNKNKYKCLILVATTHFIYHHRNLQCLRGKPVVHYGQVTWEKWGRTANSVMHFGLMGFINFKLFITLQIYWWRTWSMHAYLRRQSLVLMWRRNVENDISNRPMKFMALGPSQIVKKLPKSYGTRRVRQLNCLTPEDGTDWVLGNVG
jgi:hypothetical protein